MLCRVAATRHGFDFEEGVLRPLPTKHRYLPPPGEFVVRSHARGGCPDLQASCVVRGAASVDLEWLPPIGVGCYQALVELSSACLDDCPHSTTRDEPLNRW